MYRTWVTGIQWVVFNKPSIFITEVSAYFKPGTSVTYTFKEPYELTKNASSQSSSMYSDVTLRGEHISFSFHTAQAPALLLYANSYYREYLAVLLNRNGELIMHLRFVRIAVVY